MEISFRYDEQKWNAKVHIIYSISMYLYSIVCHNFLLHFLKLFHLRFHYSIFVIICFFFIIVEVHCKRPVAS